MFWFYFRMYQKLSVMSPFLLIFNLDIPKLQRVSGPDHVQVFWKHKSIGNQASDWLTRYVNQSEAWFQIDLCFQNTYAS